MTPLKYGELSLCSLRRDRGSSVVRWENEQGRGGPRVVVVEEGGAKRVEMDRGRGGGVCVFRRA